MNLRRLFLVLFMGASLQAAGAADKPLRIGDVQRVAVRDSVEVISHFRYVGTTDAVMLGVFGGLFGGAGAAANAAMAEGPDKEGGGLQADMRAAGFDLGSHFRGEIARRITERRLFASVGGGSPQAVFQVILRKHGLVVAPTGFKRLKPMMAGSLELRTPDDKVLWKDDAELGNTHDLVRGQTYEEYKGNIQLLCADFRVLSAKLAEKIVDELAANRGAPSTKPGSVASKTASSHRFC